VADKVLTTSRPVEIELKPGAVGAKALPMHFLKIRIFTRVRFEKIGESVKWKPLDE
jgi:hypothetical protein